MRLALNLLIATAVLLPIAAAYGQVALPSETPGVDRPPASFAAGERPSSPSALNPLAAVSLPSLVNTRERPIFTPTRRAPKLPNMPPQKLIAEPSRPELALLGVITEGSGGLAIFRDEKTQLVVRLQIGQTYAGWTLQKLDHREAAFERDNKISVLTIPSAPAK